MKVLAALVALLFGCAVSAQYTEIPWHPKVPQAAPKAGLGGEGKSGKGKAAKGKKAGRAMAPKEAGPPKYHMTFDKMTTLSPGVYVAEGNVRFESQGMLLTADSVTYDSEKGTLWATGQVSVDWNDFTVSGSELHYDINAGTGDMRDAYGVQQDGDFTVFGSTIKKTGPDWYEVDEGTFTACAAAVPPWSMRVSKGRFHVDNYAFLTNPRFAVRDVPILYSPYLIWPIKPDRSTGFLIPQIGSSTSKGFTVATAFFIAPSDWWDDTVYADYYADEGWGLGEELRYALSDRAYGWFHGYYIKQKSDDRKRWDFTWTHLQNFDHGWSFVADINLLSDIDFPRDYQRDYYKATISGTDSRLFLSRMWGPYSFNVFAERRREYFTLGRDIIQSATPEVQFRSSLQPLVGDLYAGFETSLAYLHKEWGEYVLPVPVMNSISYGRVDIHPFAQYSFHPTFWLDITPRLEARATGYGQSKDPLTKKYDAGQLWRTYGLASLDVSGPRLYRKFKNGVKHVIEPYLAYSYISQDAQAVRIPVYDEVDAVPLDQNEVRLGIRNRVYTKAGDLLFDADLYQAHSFGLPMSVDRLNTSQNSPVTLLLHAWPEGRWSADLRLRYNILSHVMDGQSLAVTYRPKEKDDADYIRFAYLRSGNLGVSQYSNYTTALPAKEVRLAAGISLGDGKVTINPFVARDLMNKEWRDLRLVFWWHGSCFAIGFDVGKRTQGLYQDTTYRFLVSLKGAGTVVDLNGGTGNYAQ